MSGHEAAVLAADVIAEETQGQPAMNYGTSGD
jgi:hypothetical protein